MFFEPNPAGFEAITRNGPSSYRIPAREALGPGTGRQGRWRSPRACCPPSAFTFCGCRPARAGDVGKTTVNHLYSVISGKARRQHRRPRRTKAWRSATSSRAVLARPFARG